VARTGWDANAAIFEMKMHEYQFNNHQHLDNGSFQIYYRGPLAIDSGLYAAYGTDHDTNYLKRTIAHNALVVFDPAEKFREGRALNDGGQRWPADGSEPRTLEVLLPNGYRVAADIQQQTTADFCKLGGDLTQSYSAKVAEYRREFIWINLHDVRRPAALIVYDRVRSARSECKKTWAPAQHRRARSGWSGDSDPSERRQTGEPHAGAGGFPNRNRRWTRPRIRDQRREPSPGPCSRAAGRSRRLSHRDLPAKAAEFDTFLNVIQVMDDEVEPLPVTRTKDGVKVGSRKIRVP
jgi:heparin/heparan-sulfate lyase